ncbi:MAG: hypothetical protein AB1646_25900 [Thermodesulfobacteriota bacterium]
MNVRVLSLFALLVCLLTATDASAHGITALVVVIFGLPFLLAIAAVCALLGGVAKRRLIAWLWSGGNNGPQSGLIPVFRVEEVIAIPLSLVAATYLLEEMLRVPFHKGYGANVLLLTITALLSAALLIFPHMRILAARFRDHGLTVSFTNRLGVALMLSLITPGVFAVVLIALSVFWW